MATARSIASLTLSFGLVNVPVKLYSATESSGAIRFNMLAPDGARVRQQYVSDTTGEVVERASMIKGYEFEDGQFVTFTKDELKALDESASHVIEVVAFVPDDAVDPLYYDTAYFLAPDKRGGKPYWLLAEAMRESGRCALAKWVNRGKQYVSQVRATDDGLVMQQLLYADEVRSLKDLGIEHVDVSAAELKLALQFIEQIAEDGYDPSAFKDDEKNRVLEAIDRKIAGKQVITSVRHEEAAPGGAQVIDLVEALKASLGQRGTAKTAAKKTAPAKAAKPAPKKVSETEALLTQALKERKGVRRAPKVEERAVASSPRARARK